MGVLHPLRLVIENYPEGQVEEMTAINNPEDASMGTRRVPFSKILYVEQDDFMEDPPRKFYRLGPGREVRLRYAYLVTCVGFTKDPETGHVTEIRCTYDPETRGGNAPDGRRVRGTIHWVSADHAIRAKARLYDHLFSVPKPEEGDFKDYLNPNSLVTLEDCKLEPGMADAEEGTPYQFERIGYFCLDGPDSQSLERLHSTGRWRCGIRGGGVDGGGSDVEQGGRPQGAPLRGMWGRGKGEDGFRPPCRGHEDRLFAGMTDGGGCWRERAVREPRPYGGLWGWGCL